MRRGGPGIASAVLAAAILLFAPAAFAFSLRVGPFHISFPSHGHRHYHRHHFFARSGPTGPVHSAVARGTASALFYPQLALPDVLANVFSSPSAWPFDYQSIVLTAFTKQEPQNRQLCEPQSDLAGRLLAPVDAVLALTEAQAPLLDKLGDALESASTSLVKACPTIVASTPNARLQLMGGQIGQIATALGGVRQPLQDFQHALTDEQLARFAAMIAPTSANNTGGRPKDAAPGCGGDAASVTDRAISLIEQTVAPSAAQRDALNVFKSALGDAATDLQADCAAPMSPTELGRLGTIETRLDTTRRVLRAIETALTSFKGTLSDEQKAQLDAASFAAR